MKKQVNDLVGRFFGELEVLRRAEQNVHTKNHSTYWVCKCHLCGNEKTIARGHLTHSNIEDCGCRKGKSKGELKIAELLNTNGLQFKEQWTYDDLRYKNLLRFDFAVLNEDGSVKYLIEYDGKQHFEEVARFGGLETFISQRAKDTIKNEYCVKNGITLIRIPYTKKPEILNIRMLKPYGNKFKITKQNAKNFVDYFLDI